MCNPLRLHLFTLLIGAALFFRAGDARADQLSARVKELAGADHAKLEAAIDAIAKEPRAESLTVLDSLLIGTLRIDEKGVAYQESETGVLEPILDGTEHKP